MFSYTINNPNNVVITNDYFVIPFGHRCSSALACKYASIRNCSLPFDWCKTLFPKKIKEVLQNNFEDFIPDVLNNTFCNKYKIEFPHFNHNIDVGIEEYKRRIARFNDMLTQSKKIYFVYINEDYLYDDTYRTDDFNDAMFNEMVELDTFIKDKYIHLDYTILYFNFKQHSVPENSNIVNIVLHTANVYDTDTGGPNEELRGYCGKILAELFHTNLIFGYSTDTFNN
jgi:hypothetical protein